MFGFSFSELLVICVVALVAVGPQKLPGMLKTMGQWARKLRQMTQDVRQQTGIDEMLRAEGIQLSELRSLMRGYHGGFGGMAAAAATATAPSPASAPAPAADPVTSSHHQDPYADVEPDPTREYPLEGADACGALADDLLEPAASDVVAAAPGAPPQQPEPTATVAETAAATATPAESPSDTQPAAATVMSTAESLQALPEVEPEVEPLPQPEPVAAKRVTSAPPAPSSRPAASRPASLRPAGTPPPPPRRSLPPRPEPSTPAAAPSGSGGPGTSGTGSSTQGSG